MHATDTTGPVPTLVTYRPKPGHEDALLALVKKHWPMLNELGLSTTEPAKLWRAKNRDGSVAFVELFSWKNGAASGIAHQTPEVMAVWEPMGEHMADMSIQQVEAID